MQSPTSRRRVASAAPPATPVAGAVAPGPPVLRFVLANGMLEIEDAVTAVRLLESQQRDRLAAEAEQAALSVCYKVGGQPDPTKPYNGLLTERLGISQRSAEQLLRDGKLRYVCAGKKLYRVSELACRQFLG
ncbi:MAG: hypothetical protein EOO61_16235, partial [Hymenobacter sp.]